MNVHGPLVVGVDVDDQTRCAHYRTDVDVVALKFACCDTYYPCYQCHEELANHAAEVWPLQRADEKAVLCGVCKAELTVPEYIHSGYSCPHCRAAFNPRCERHYNLYFAASLYERADLRFATSADARAIHAVMMDKYNVKGPLPP